MQNKKFLDDIQSIQNFLNYDENHPIGDFFMYDGSLTTPSCAGLI